MERRLEEAIAMLAQLHVRPPSPEEDEEDPGDSIITGHGKLTGIAAPPQGPMQELSIEQLLKWYKGNEVWAMAIIQNDKEEAQEPIPPEIQAVLETFMDVFATPNALPPERTYDHAIPLKSEAVPFNARPYIYSPAHKDEIERRVRTMLDSGVIVPIWSTWAILSLPMESPLIQKTEAMGNWPQPTTITELRGFLGLTGYYRKFVRNYAIIAKPLTNILKKKSFVWTNSATAAFQALKQAMLTTPVLQLPDFTKQFLVKTDACDLGIGVVLMQENHPLVFLSKPLSQTHQQLSIYEKEFLALLMAVERWRPYLQRGEFLIKTDHHSLRYLEDQNLQSPLQRKAMARLMGLQFKITHRKGGENNAADSLSRVGHLMAIQTCATVQPTWLQEVLNSYVTDQDA
ncbi:hypothetical protein QYE76_019464 [Lolium multiflorum]|uniref:Reverse transcriptase/retrotransposon-derived protein RNase H-like domain-containing protein n=1 Tax=Lolium multiflorum TaxID=4521 RepID=A0AAD8R551_LOLMU|nr:hypothetical protein QYE76_019464 [Lolium multiflorum]